MKGDTRQFPVKAQPPTRAVPQPEASWPDGTARSQNNAFNWRTGAPSAFSANGQAERQRKFKEQQS